MCVAGGFIYANIAVLLPVFVVENHPEVSSSAVGILLSSYQITTVLAAFLLGKYIHRWGHRCSFYLAIVVLSFSTALYAAAGWSNNSAEFYTLSFVSRLG